MTNIEANEPVGNERAARVTLSRTWELELFISGATVFALLQAPAVVDGWWARTEPHLAGGADMAAFFAYYYAKLILYTLISTFIIHLVTRAYWVALVGLHSVYPNGVRWEELRFGPAFLTTYRERLPSLESAIRRVDDISSLLFSGGAVVLLMFLMSVLLVASLGLFGLVAAKLFFGGQHADTIAGVCLFVLMLIPIIGRSVDATRGKKEPDAVPGRGMLFLARLSYAVTFTAPLGPLQLVMASNIGRRTSTWAFALVLCAILGTFVVRDVLMGNDALRANTHLYVPDQRTAQEQDPAFYADRRDPNDVYETTPAIQSEIIRDPYVRVFVPITPGRHNELIGERCPDVPQFRSGLRLVTSRSLASEPPDVAPLLSCLADLQPVSLDGQPLDLAYRLTTDRHSGVRGIVAFIPVAGLQPGEHILRVEALPRPEPEPGNEPLPVRPPFLIHFWL